MDSLRAAVDGRLSIFSDVIAYYRMAIQYAAQVDAAKAKLTLSVKMAGNPPPKQPDPQVQSAQQDIMAHAVPMIDRLTEIAMTPPLPKGTSLTPQYQAAKEIVDTATKAAQLTTH